MTDRVKAGTGNSSKLMCPSTYAPTDFASFLQDLKDGVVYVDITPNDAGCTEAGTALNKANLLSDATASGFGFDATDDPTIDDVLERIGADYIEGTLTAGQTTVTLTDARFTSDSMIDVYCETLTDGTTVSPYKKALSTGSLTLTFITSYAINIGIKVRVM